MSGWEGGMVTTVAIFLPSFLLLIGTLPFWDLVRRRPRFQAGLLGVNATVVGILLAALYDPVFISAMKSPADFGLALARLHCLFTGKVAPWIVVLFRGVLLGFF